MIPVMYIKVVAVGVLLRGFPMIMVTLAGHVKRLRNVAADLKKKRDECPSSKADQKKHTQPHLQFLLLHMHVAPAQKHQVKTSLWNNCIYYLRNHYSY